MKMNEMAPRAHRITVSAFALAGCLALPAGAATSLSGNYSINAGGGEAGNLNVTAALTVGGNSALNGNADVGGALGVLGAIDFGVATSNGTLPGLTMQYLGSAQHDAAFDLTDSLGSFLWRDNAGATLRPKMKLGTDNVLSVYNAAGTTATITLQGGTGQINLTGTGSGIYANGSSVFTVGSTGGITWDRALGISNTTDSLSSTTGALTVAGGIGVAKDSYVHGVRIGQGAGNLNSNTVLGAEAMIANTTGYGNAAVGYQALNVNTTGYSNAVLGYQGLSVNTTGRQNISVGYQALKANTTGNNNTATGYWSLLNTTTPNGNSAYGAVSLRYNTTGAFNSAVGNGASTDNSTGSNNASLGAFALRYNTTGSNNVGVGYNAGINQGTGIGTLTSPENSIYIGAGSRGFSDSDDNSIVIGYNALGEGANTTVIGNSSTTSTHLYGETNADSLKVNGGTDLNDQVVVEPATAPATAVRAMRVLANGTILIRPGGDLSMGGFNGGDQP